MLGASNGGAHGQSAGGHQDEASGDAPRAAAAEGDVDAVAVGDDTAAAHDLYTGAGQEAVVDAVEARDLGVPPGFHGRPVVAEPLDLPAVALGFVHVGGEV